MARHRVQSRKEQGFRLRSMYRSLGLDRGQAAKVLHVSTRTLHNWESGSTSIPGAAYKLLRLLCGMELPGRDWQGWSFNRGTLWSPEGHGFTGKDFAWLSMTIRQARLFPVVYREASRLRLELIAERRAYVERLVDQRPDVLDAIVDLVMATGRQPGPSGPGGKRSAPGPEGRGGTVTLPERFTGETWKRVLPPSEEASDVPR